METLNILVLEDEILAARDLRDTLLNAGYPMPKLCRNIEESKIALKSTLFDLAILDIELGNQQSGIELARILNQDFNVPFIFLTAHDDDENFQLAMETKPAAYLIKPFKARELDLQIRVAYFNRSREASVSPEISPYLFLPIQGGVKKIAKSDIIYLQAKKFSTDVYLNNSLSPERFSVNIGYLEQFMGEDFVRISRSNIINLKYMDEINNGTISLNGQFLKKVNLSVSSHLNILKLFPVIRRK